uniref:ATP synthase F0 subunit 8 n=1 Tax=Scolytoplatypus skyliuae TaxID=2894163 RepID=UPI0023AAFC14|nr:ATP synthase F0 subunit 8 [Scolytoplatypus skyliuae]WCB99751.1 ATP synthase F0 subunit 8 [Scolytoplatypus skyliuae]
MAPMNWTSLLIMFFLLFYFYMIICFFLIYYKSPTHSLKMIKNPMINNWKW